MKRFMFLLVLLAGTSGNQSYAQTVESSATASNVEIINHPYYHNEEDGVLKPLEKAIAATKTRRKALGYGGVDFLYEIPGEQSAFRITDAAQLEFLMNTNGASAPEMVLYRLESRKGKRHATGASYKTFSGMQSGDGVIPYNVMSGNDGLQRIVPSQELVPGEYFFAGAAVEGSTTMPVFAFGID